MNELPGNKRSLDCEVERAIVPKNEPTVLDFELPTENLWTRNVGHNVASSSGSNLRSSLIGMGFLPSLVDRVIDEKGKDDADLLVQTLLTYSKSNSESSDSLDSLFDNKGVNTPPEVSISRPKEEPDIFDGINEDKRASLLTMNFSVNEVAFAIDKLGEDAPISEMVDLIIAAKIAEKHGMEVNSRTHDEDEKNEDTSNETLFGIMEKTLCLLQMGFTENQVSAAFEKFGPRVPVSELADSILAGQIADDYSHTDKDFGSSGMGIQDILTHNPYDLVRVKSEDLFIDAASRSRDINRGLNREGKRPKQECYEYNLVSTSQIRRCDYLGKRPKQEYLDDSACLGDSIDHKPTGYELSAPFKYSPFKSIDRVVAKPPYFFYGNVMNVCNDSWVKISQFLYGLAPEFVNTRFFSALIRKEGYVHNLPTEGRFHIVPKSPMTIEDAIPHTKRWWPSWDTRKQFSCISYEDNGTSQLCERLGKVLTNSRGLLSPEQQKDILHHCRTLSLVWAGPHKLCAIEPEHLERILGYPKNHTQDAGYSSIQRLQALKHCFQIDTLGYHLSMLKTIYPDGLTMLSIFTGIGGAEVALHQLGVPLKGVVSVEMSVVKQRILRRWWENTGQKGELVQVEDIQKLTTNTLKSLIEKFGGFDLVVSQNPCSNFMLGPMKAADSDDLGGFNFPLFYEFVRVLQRVRNMYGSNS